MDALPPNDPNNNNNGGRGGSGGSRKPAPYDGQSRRDRSAPGSDEEVMEAVDMRDAPVVVVMFLVGMAAWMLRARCIC